MLVSVSFFVIQCLDYECEMVIVVGKKARDVSVSLKSLVKV